MRNGSGARPRTSGGGRAVGAHQQGEGRSSAVSGVLEKAMGCWWLGGCVECARPMGDAPGGVRQAWWWRAWMSQRPGDLSRPAKMGISWVLLRVWRSGGWLGNGRGLGCTWWWSGVARGGGAMVQGLARVLRGVKFDHG